MAVRRPALLMDLQHRKQHLNPGWRKQSSIPVGKPVRKQHPWGFPDAETTHIDSFIGGMRETVASAAHMQGDTDLAWV